MTNEKRKGATRPPKDKTKKPPKAKPRPTPPRGKSDPPLPHAIATFGPAGSAQVSVKVEYDPSRTNYKVYASQSDTSPAGNSAALLATSPNHPAYSRLGGTMGYTEGDPLYVALTYTSGGSNTRTGIYPGADVALSETEKKTGLS